MDCAIADQYSGMHTHSDRATAEAAAELQSATSCLAQALCQPQSVGEVGGGPPSWVVYWAAGGLQGLRQRLRLPEGCAAAAEAPGAAGGVRCDLPALDPLHCGREEAAVLELRLLREGVRALLLLGPCGMGKSSLALEVGWRLWWEAGAQLGTLCLRPPSSHCTNPHLYHSTAQPPHCVQTGRWHWWT